jgi:hypothetical protein
MKPVTGEYVEKSTKHALEFISRIADGVPTTLPKLSPVVFKDYDVVLMLLEISHSVSLMGRQIAGTFDYLSKEEQELGTEYATVVLEAVCDDFQAGPDGETPPTLRYAIENFQWWLEFLTNASARIKLGIKRSAA